MCPYADAPYGRHSWSTPPRARHGGPINATTLEDGKELSDIDSVKVAWVMSMALAN
jgi:hypothetical protein